MNVQILLIMIFLAIVQGVAEFLPISSSGHLTLIENIPWVSAQLAVMGDNAEMFLNVMLHLATLAGVLIFLRKDLWNIIRGFFVSIARREWTSPAMRTVFYLFLASIPAGLAGVLLNDFFESMFASPAAVAGLLIANGILLILTKKIPVKGRKYEEAGIVRALLIGCAQALAVLPGISRSGSTIAGGMASGLEPEQAARFSFLMSIPVIAGAGLLEGKDALAQGLPDGVLLPLLLAMVVAVIVAILSLRLLFALVRRVRLDVFGYYTIALGCAALIVIALC